MSYLQRYQGVIWTNHAIERMGQRKLSQEYAYQTFAHPDKQISGKQPGTIESQKQFGKHYVTVISKQNERGEWIVLSCWVDPPMHGTADYDKKQKYNKYRNEYRNASFWGKIWLEVKGLFGL